MIAFIDDHRQAHGVEPICRVLPIALSTYHAHVAKRVDPSRLSARDRRDAALKEEVRRVFEANFRVYGVRKVWRQLQREGFDAARCTVARLMRAMGLEGIIRGKPIRTTVSDKAAPCPLDHVNRQFHAPAPNMLWVSDFTYVATWTGFVYVAFVATLAGFPALVSWSYLAFKSGLKRVATGWHVDGLADSCSASSDEGASAPTAGLPGDWREAGETCSLACLEGAELRHFDEQGEGGYGRDARNAGEDCEPLGEIGVSSDLLEDCRLDRRHLAIDLFEALRILTPQQGGGQNLAAVLGCGAVLHQGFAGEVKLLEREQSVAAGRPLLKLQHCTHARQHRCIQAVGFRQTADRLGEAARLTRIDLGVRNAGRAQGDFESAVIKADQPHGEGEETNRHGNNDALHVLSPGRLATAPADRQG